MTMQETTSTPSRAAIAELLRLMAARHGFIVEWSLSRTEEIAALYRAISKKSNLRNAVMPEYFERPAWWVATVKSKPGELKGRPQLTREGYAQLEERVKDIRERQLLEMRPLLIESERDERPPRRR